MTVRPTGRRVPVVLGLVVVLLGAPGLTADAAWGTSGPGTSTARGGVITTPTGVAAGTASCSGSNAVVTYRWTAVPGAAAYQWDASPVPDYGQYDYSDVTSSTSATVQRTTRLPVTQFFRVRAFAGNWSSAFSPNLAGVIGPC